MVGALALAAGCGDDAETVDGDGAPIDDVDAHLDGDGAPIDPPDGGGDDIDAGEDVVGASCDGTTQCSDGEDNDGDGYVDLDDPHCASCFDDDESSFATGIPGDNKSNDGTQDCFFDGDTGQGNDGCNVPDCCYDPDDDTCSMYDEDGNLSQTCDEGFTDECIEICGAGTPPGCDCIGCCTVCSVCEDDDPDCTEEDEQCLNIFRGADFSDFPDCDPNDPTSFTEENCPTCEQHDDCSGPDCEDDECVLCAGEDEDDIGDQCDSEDSCPGGTACTDNSDCADDEYCALGCCVSEIE